MFYFGDKILAYWFLQVLFVVEILNAFFLRIYHRISYCIVIIIMSIIGYMLSIYNIHFPFRFEVCGLASLFYGIGYLSKSFIMKWTFNSVYIFFFILLTFLISLFIPKLDMNYNIYGSYVPNIFAAIFGSFTIIQCGKWLEKHEITIPLKSFLLWAGRNSIIVMGLSQIVNLAIKHIMSDFEFPQIIDMCSRHILLWIILYFLSLFINKYTPCLIGKQ